MTTIEERIKAQKEKLKQLKALKQKQEALTKTKQSKQERAVDTRKKILIGAMMLEHMGKNEATQANIIGKLTAYLTRKDDRELFGLEPLPKQEETT